MLLDRETQQKVDGFRKYATFISEKFGITVELDGARACTNGKVISIPNIAGMDAKEIEFLYAIVLHEVGHIRYSNFTPEFFKSVKSDAHFNIINAVEDARIENLLMKDFDGAHDILSSLYNQFSLDKRFMNRVFGADLSKADLWHNVGCYVHSSIIKLDKKFSFMKVIKTDNRKKLQKWAKTNNIDALIANHPVKTAQDAVDLGTKIYKLFFKTKEDNSATNNTGKLTKLIDKALNEDTEVLKEKAEKLQKALDKIAKEHSDLQGQMDKMVSDKEAFRKSIRGELDEIRDEQKNLSDAIKTKKALQAKDRKLNSAEKILARKKQTIEDGETRRDETIREMHDERESEEPNQNKIDKLKKKLDKMKAKQDKLHAKNKVLRDKIEKYKKELERAKKDHSKLPQDMQDSSRTELIDKFKKNIARKGELGEKLADMESDIEDKEQEVNEKAQEYHDTRKKAGKEISNGMKDLEDKLHSENVPSEIMPKFDNVEGWDEANNEQEKFDKRASKESGDVVTNGAGFAQQDTRDILALIDKTKNDLQAIDLSKHFLDTHKASKLESFNDISTEITYTEVVEVGENVALVNRRHVPLTTQFDKVVNENTSNGVELEALKRKNADVLSKVRSIFRQRLKFQKKDRFKGNQEEGGLDNRNLYKIVTGTDDRFYEVNDPRFVNRIVGSVVLDVSGSMDKNEDAERLREMAMFLSEGLTDCYIKHEVSGFHAPVNHEMRKVEASDVYNRTVNNLETVIYKKFDDRKNTGIQNVKVHCSDNSDGESLRILGQRLIKQQAKRRVMFICTDGKPFLSSANVGMMDADLKDAIKWLQRNKVEIFAFGFNDKGKEFFGDRFCHVKTYQDMINFCWKKLA